MSVASGGTPSSGTPSSGTPSSGRPVAALPDLAPVAHARPAAGPAPASVQPGGPAAVIGEPLAEAAVLGCVLRAPSEPARAVLDLLARWTAGRSRSTPTSLRPHRPCWSEVSRSTR